MNTHLTADGRKLTLCEMSDTHLQNVINLTLNNAEALKNMVKSGEGAESITEILHGVSRKQQIALAKQKLREIYERLPHYIMEASMRGMDFSLRLRETFEREKGPARIELPLSFRIESLIEE
jgi:hypothetical protein